MAVVAGLQQDKDKEQQDQQAPGVIAQPGVVGQPQAQAPARPSQQGSGRFTNIQKYIEANKGAGSKLASGTVEKTVGKEAEKVAQGIQASQQQFGQKAQSEQQRLESGRGQIGQLISNAPNLNQEQIKQFQQLRRGEGQNLSGLEDLNQLQSGVGQVGNLAQMAKSEQGRFGLLKQAYARPSYSAGQQKLDQLLLQTAPGALSSVQQQAQQRAQQAQQTLSGAQSEAQARANAINSLRTQAAQEAQQAIGGAMGGLESELQTRAQQKTAQGQRFKELMGRTLSGGALSEQEAADLEQMTKGAGIDMNVNTYGALSNEAVRNNFLAGQVNQAKAADVASAEEANRLKALSQLAESEGGVLGDIKQAEAAGTLGKYNPLAAMNQGALVDAINQQKASYEAAVAADPRASQIKGYEDLATNLGRFSSDPYLDEYTRAAELGIRNEGEGLRFDSNRLRAALEKYSNIALNAPTAGFRGEDIAEIVGRVNPAQNKADLRSQIQQGLIAAQQRHEQTYRQPALEALKQINQRYGYSAAAPTRDAQTLASMIAAARARKA